MTRPTQGCEVLGEDGDPVPGDPEEVARLGRELCSPAPTYSGCPATRGPHAWQARVDGGRS